MGVSESDKKMLSEIRSAAINVKKSMEKKDAIIKDLRDEIGVVKAATKSLLDAAQAADGSLSSPLLAKPLDLNVVAVPEIVNPLRNRISITNYSANAEIAKCDFDIKEFGFLADGVTANEVAMSASSITFERYRFKVATSIVDTVLGGTTTNLTDRVFAALRSALAYKELSTMFATTPESGLEHMSLYGNGLTAVTGADSRQAILNAYADLESPYRPRAIAVMNPQTWVQIFAASNGGQARDIIGMPVVLVDQAITPIVGDFTFYCQNFAVDNVYDSKKNVSTGVTTHTLTAWLDIRVMMNAAFRLAQVSA